MLRGMRGLAESFSRIELEGDAEGDIRVGAEGEFAIEIMRVCWHACWCHVFGAITEFMSCLLATKAEGGRVGSIISGLAFLKGGFVIQGSKVEFA